MQDYIPQDPNRKKIIHADGTIEYVHIESADNPVANNPTPINKASLLDDNTCAMLGLPGTATPNQALAALPGFFPFQQVTAGTETEFGMEGNLKNGVLSNRFEVKGDVSTPYYGAKAGFSVITETDAAGEFILIDSASVQNVTSMKRLKLKDDFSVSVLRDFRLIDDGKSYMTTIIHTEVSEEYIAVSAQNDAPYQVLINRAKWNGTDFQKVGNTFTLPIHGEVSQYRIVHFAYSGTQNVYVIHSSEYRQQENKTYSYFTAIKWNGTSFSVIGSEFSLGGLSSHYADIYKAGAANEFVFPVNRDQSIGLHRVKWNGNSFSFVGNKFTVGVYTGFSPSTKNLLQESAEEYTVFINYNSNNHDIARVRWDGAAFSLVGALFHCNIYTEGNKYAYEKIEYSSEPNKYCAIQRKNDGAVYGRSVFLDYILWDGNRFYRSGRKREAWFKWLEVNGVTNIRVKNSKNLQLVLAQGKYAGSHVGVQAACVFINESNATALQTAAPNEKVWVVKE